MVNGKGRKNPQGSVQRGQRNNSVRGRPAAAGGANKNKKNINSPKKSQAWRLQRQQSNGGFVPKRYKQNGGQQRAPNKPNLSNKTNERVDNPSPRSRQTGFSARRAAAIRASARRTAARRAARKTGALPPLNRGRNNIAPAKRFMTPAKGIKRVSSAPNLRDPNSVYNRLGYQSPAQVAYRHRVKRAKQLLLQRQSQRHMPNDRLVIIIYY